MSNITLNNMKFNGTVYDPADDNKKVKNDVIIANCTGDIVVKDCVFNGDNYNVFYTNYNPSDVTAFAIPKNVVIENCRFEGVTVNNSISVHALQNNGTITVKNCHFKKVSNALRFFNATSATNVTINVENCTCDEWETSDDYRGFFLFEDHYNEDAIDKKVFGPEHVTVNVKNLVGPNGKVLPSDVSLVLGTKDANQIGYVYYSKGASAEVKGVRPYDTTVYPTFKFE